MPDYDSLTKAELIVELNNRDAEIVTLNQTIDDKDIIISDKIEEVQELNQVIDEMKTPEGSLNTIIEMSSEDKQSLAHKVRTTNEGIKTYFAINYGADAPEKALVEEE